MTRAWPLVFCVGCRGLLGIDEAVPLPNDGALHDGSGSGDDGDPSDAALDGAPAGDDVAHVLPADEYLGTGNLAVTADFTLDTTNLTSTPGLPRGVTLASATQDTGGPELAILRVDNLTISAGKRLRAVGSRPLVVLANAIQIDGVFDVSAIHDVPGAGGVLGGPGAGGPGMRAVMYSDSGGGGGGFGVSGARGGNTPCTTECNPDQTVVGGPAGTPYNSGLGQLQGGSGGGAALAPAQPTACPAGVAGAGGGALELYAKTAITIGGSGGILGGGGGGRGGFKCETPYNWLAGSGGGSGGAIFLQAPIVTNAGVLAANGGGGGSGGGMNGNGIDGEDGKLATTVATGGPPQGTYSAKGGNGGAGSIAPQAGVDGVDQGNAGGGGGALGQLVIFFRTTIAAGTTSPAPITQMY